MVRCTAALEASGRLALLAACDREWIVAHGECWQAVDIGGKLYCCDCRSLYEGTPLGEGAVDTLSEETAPYCASCGREL